MAFLNGNLIIGITTLSHDELAQKLIATSPNQDGKRLEIVLKLEEEADLFLDHEALAPWFERIVKEELERQGKPATDLKFVDQGGGVFQS